LILGDSVFSAISPPKKLSDGGDPRLPRHATPTIQSLILSLFVCQKRGHSIESILRWVQEGGSNATRETIRKQIQRIKQEGLIEAKGSHNLPIYIERGNRIQEQINENCHAHKGDPIPPPSRHATPTPNPSDRHGIRCYGLINPQTIEEIKGKLPYTNLSRFFVPRFVPPLEKDKAQQWKFEGESVKVMISEAGRCQVYPILIGWETELAKWFPTLAEEIAKGDPRTRSHKGFDREAWGRYHEAKYGEFKINCAKGVTISGDHSPPGASIEIMASERDQKAAEADSFGLDEATRLALTFQIREEQRRLSARVEEIGGLLVLLSKAIVPPKGPGGEGGMFG
jgi:hypothetical protein